MSKLYCESNGCLYIHDGICGRVISSSAQFYRKQCLSLCIFHLKKQSYLPTDTIFLLQTVLYKCSVIDAVYLEYVDTNFLEFVSYRLMHTQRGEKTGLEEDYIWLSGCNPCNIIITGKTLGLCSSTEESGYFEPIFGVLRFHIQVLRLLSKTGQALPMNKDIVFHKFR